MQHRRSTSTPLTAEKMLNQLYKSRFGDVLPIETTFYCSDSLRKRIAQVERAATESNEPSVCAIVLVSSGERAKKLNILRVFSEDPLRYSGGEVRMSNQYVLTQDYTSEGIASKRGIIGTPTRVHDAIFNRSIITFQQTQIIVVDNDILENKPEQRMPCLAILKEFLRYNNTHRTNKKIALYVNPTIPIPATPFYIDSNSSAIPGNRIETHQSNPVSNNYNANTYSSNQTYQYNQQLHRQRTSVLSQPQQSQHKTFDLWNQFRTWAYGQGYPCGEITPVDLGVVSFSRNEDWKLRNYISKTVSSVNLSNARSDTQMATTHCVVVAASGERAKRFASLDWPENDVYRLFGGAGSIDFQRNKLSDSESHATRKYTFGTPQRIRHFCSEGALSLKFTQYFIIDANIVDTEHWDGGRENQRMELFHLFRQYLEPAIAKFAIYKQISAPPIAVSNTHGYQSSATTLTTTPYQRTFHNAPATATVPYQRETFHKTTSTTTTVPAYRNTVQSVPVVANKLAFEPKNEQSNLKHLRNEAEDRLRGMYGMWSGGTSLPKNLKVAIATTNASLRRVVFSDFDTSRATYGKSKYDPTTVSTLVFAPSGVRCDRLCRSLKPRLDMDKEMEPVGAGEPLRLFGGPENMGKQRDFLERTRINTIKVAVALPDRVRSVVKENILTLNGLACIVIDNHILENLDNDKQRNDLFSIMAHLNNVENVFFLIYFPPPPSSFNGARVQNDTSSGGTMSVASEYEGGDGNNNNVTHQEENIMDKLLKSPVEIGKIDSEKETANNNNTLFNRALSFKNGLQVQGREDFAQGGANFFVKKIQEGSYQVNVSKIKPGVTVEVKFNSDGAQSVIVREEN